MKKAFTLIELLVVIAIIAILAAILFPVFAQAKLAAKKTQGLSQVKQIGTGLQIYLNDADDTLPPYRFTDNSTIINPTYLKLQAAGDPKAAKIETQAQHAVFINQLLDPYVKNDDIWKAPTNPGAWVNVEATGTEDAGYLSYGGQNSYGMNNYVFKSIVAGASNNPSLFSATAIAEPSNTLGIVDATYYNVLPAMPNDTFCTLGGYSKTGSYLAYWKELGNSKLNFNAYTPVNPDAAANADVVKKVESRYNGVLNIVRMDTSAKALNAKAVINNLKAGVATSYWNPVKTACE